MIINKNLIKTVVYLVYLVIVWTLFRMNSIFPDAIEELWFKPALWLVPLFWLNMTSNNKIKLLENKKSGVIWGVGLGLVYMFFLAIYLGIRRIELSWNDVGIGLVMAVTENLVIFGYVLPRYLEVFSERKAIIMTALVYVAVRSPIIVLVIGESLPSVVGLLVLSLSIGVINGYVRIRSRSTWAPILGGWSWNVFSVM